MNNDWLINRKEIVRYLGYRDQEPDEIMTREIEECEQRFLKVVQPKSTYQVFDLIHQEDRLFTSDLEFEFVGKSIEKHLKDCEKVAFSCLTLSQGVDELIDQAQQEDMLHALLYDAIANASVEEARYQLEQKIQMENPEWHINWLFGIGYGDLPLTLQPQFLTKIDAKQKIGLTVNDKCILSPLKSVTGFVGLSEKKVKDSSCQQKSCQKCNLKSKCSYHR